MSETETMRVFDLTHPHLSACLAGVTPTCNTFWLLTQRKGCAPISAGGLFGQGGIIHDDNDTYAWLWPGRLRTENWTLTHSSMSEKVKIVVQDPGGQTPSGPIHTGHKHANLRQAIPLMLLAPNVNTPILNSGLHLLAFMARIQCGLDLRFIHSPNSEQILLKTQWSLIPV